MDYLARTGYTGKVEDVAEAACVEYRIGTLRSATVIPIGYEDCNIKLTTDRHTYLLKALSAARAREGWDRYPGIVNAAVQAGVQTPSLRLIQGSPLGRLIMPDGTVVRTMLMDFLEGENLYKSAIGLSANDIAILAQQAAKINMIDYEPSRGYDTWAIVNVGREFEAKKISLASEDYAPVEQAVRAFQSIDVDRLPQAFVHGDIISTNVMRTVGGKLWILDFAVANRYPRIQEIAVIASDLLFDYESAEQSRSNLTHFLSEYERHCPLTDEERAALPTFIIAAHAAHVLNASAAKAEGNTTDENEHWLAKGRAGLRQIAQDI